MEPGTASASRDNWVVAAVVIAAICLFGTIVGVGIAVRSDGSGATTSAGGGEPQVVEVELGDLYVKPASITVPAGTEVTFKVENRGAMQHDFKIDNPEFWTGMLSPSQSATVVVNLPAGSYTFYCTVDGHAEAGMWGTITAV